MSIVTNFVIGFLAALVGVVPPGLLNMSAAKISMKQGRKVALMFSLGVALTVCLQTYVALLFARYLEQRDEVVSMLQKVGLGIFICLTIYFFFIAKDTRRDHSNVINKSKTNRFFYGILLAAINLLPLPYWVYLSVTFSAFGWFTFDRPGLVAAVIASGAGTFVMLLVYAQFFRKRQDRFLFRINMNYIIGLITAVISALTLAKVINNL